MYTCYADMSRKIANSIPFVSNSVKGVYDGETDTYSVFSYDTLIFKEYSDGGYFLDLRKYSRTTSRLQSLILRAYKQELRIDLLNDIDSIVVIR